MSGKMMLDDDLLEKVGGGIEGLSEEEAQNGVRSAVSISTNNDGSASLTFTATPSGGGSQKMTVYHYSDGSWHAEQDGQGPTITVNPTNQ